MWRLLAATARRERSAFQAWQVRGPSPRGNCWVGARDAPVAITIAGPLHTNARSAQPPPPPTVAPPSPHPTPTPTAPQSAHNPAPPPPSHNLHPSLTHWLARSLAVVVHMPRIGRYRFIRLPRAAD